MILDALIGLVLSVLTGVLGLMPAWSLPAKLVQGAASIGGSVASVDVLFPVVTLVKCLVVILALRALLALWGFLQWLWSAIPFKAS